MEKSKLALLVIRALQLICGVIILAMAIQDYTLLKDLNDACKAYTKHDDDKSTKTSDCDKLVGGTLTAMAFGAFVGAFAILDALVGLVGIFLSAIKWVVVLGMDGLAAIFLLSGGVNSAVVRSKALIFHDTKDSGAGSSFTTKYVTATAFMFIGFLATLATMVLVFLSRGTTTRKHSAV